MRTVFVALVALSVSTAVFAADVPVKVVVNGKLQSYNPPALMRGGTVYVPLRAGAQSLGLEVKWDATRKVAQLCDDSGCAFIMQSDGITHNGRLLLPLRRMGDITGARVVWDATKKTVVISK